MSALGKLSGNGLLTKCRNSALNQVHRVQLVATAPLMNQGANMKWKVLGAVIGGVGTLIGALEYSIWASGNEAKPFKHPWSHNGPISSFDHASIRRGFEVYKSVCASCHSMQFLPYRRMVNVFLTEEEAKREASEINVRDGPDDKGLYFDRPGKLSDFVPSPYPNEEAARAANNGAYPPDLSLITLARKGGENYIFSLLTGYMGAPAGVVLQDGQYFNPYFPGGALSMAQAIYNETVEFSDGTPASASQITKDVCTFLAWSAMPHHDERRRLLLKGTALLTIVFVAASYITRHRFALHKTAKYSFVPKRK